MTFRFILLRTLLLVWTWFACAALRLNAAPLHRYQYNQMAMGVQVRITVYASSQSVAERACAAAFERIAEIEQVMSDYRADSELMQLCAKAGGEPVRVSKELFTVLKRAQELSRRTAGAFDVTVGPYVQLWRRARRGGAFPTEEELREARQRVGYEKMVLDEANRTVRLLVPGMRLDLGGIAKGYALDCALKVLQEHGIRHVLLEAGGDIVAGLAPYCRSTASVTRCWRRGATLRRDLRLPARQAGGLRSQTLLPNAGGCTSRWGLSLPPGIRSST